MKTNEAENKTQGIRTDPNSRKTAIKNENQTRKPKQAKSY